MSDVGNGGKQVRWNTRLEEYFCETAEQAQCYTWLHKKAEELYSARTVWIDLPAIILGAINASVSIGSESLFGSTQYASVGVGVVALMTAMLTTVGSYFAWSKRCEGHRIASLSYAKLFRFLSVELALPRAERMSATDLLKYCRTENDRLAEVSPLVPPPVIDMFRKRFSDAKYERISRPQDTNGLHEVTPYPDPSALHSPSVHIQVERPATATAVRPTLDISTAPVENATTDSTVVAHA